MPQQVANAQVSFRLFEEGSLLGLERIIERLRPGQLGSRAKITLTLALAWLPLLVFSALQHMAIAKSRPESFLLDASLQARFLVALPIILVIPAGISRKLQTIVEHS